jgi:hypothetical protein
VVSTCDVKGNGVYPVINVTDIRMDGLPRNVLWRRFDLDKMNTELNSPVSVYEVCIPVVQETVVY